MPSDTERKKRKEEKLPPGILPVTMPPLPVLTNVYGPQELEDEMDTANPEAWDVTGGEAVQE